MTARRLLFPLVSIFIASATFSVSPATGAEAPIQAGDRVKVINGPAPVKVGKKTLTTLETGTELTAVKVQGPWVKVSLQRQGKPITGWIYSKKYLERVSRDQARKPERPESSKKPAKEATGTECPAIDAVVPSPRAPEPGVKASIQYAAIPQQYKGRTVVWRGKVVSETGVRIKDKGIKHYNAEFREGKVGLPIGTQVVVKGKLHGLCGIGRDFKAGAVVNDTYYVYLDPGATATPVSQSSKSAAEKGAGKQAARARSREDKQTEAAESRRAAAMRDALGLFKAWTRVAASVSSTEGSTGEELAALMEAAKLAERVLKEKGIREGLMAAARQAAQHSKAEGITVDVLRGPSISEIGAKLGKEDATETAEYRDPTARPPALPQSLTWHKYGPLHFGVVSGSVRLIRVDCRKLPAVPQR